MASITNSFTATGVSTALLVKHNDQFTYTVSNTFVGTWVLEKSEDATNYAQVATGTSTASAVPVTAIGSTGSASVYYRFRCSAYTSGTMDVEIADASYYVKPAQEFRDANGTVVMQLVEGGVDFPGTQSVSGAQSFSGAASFASTAEFTGAVTMNEVPIDSTSGVGAKNGATVTVAEYGEGIVHKSVLTLASTPVAVVSVTTGNGVGGTKIYDFPEGRILVLGAMADLTLAIAAGKQADFTDGTPEGDVGIGSVAPANADALGTDATDDDYATATAFTLTDFAGAVQCPSEASSQFDGTATAGEVYVNVLVDAADIDDDVSSEVEVSGTVTIHWINLGDF